MIEQLKNAIGSIPDFPEKGIVFRDLSPVLSKPELSKYIISELSERIRSHRIDGIVGIESRGFLYGMSMAQYLNVGFTPARKKGKLPGETFQEEYQLEYGTAVLEIQQDAIKPGMRVHIHDDLIATGGSAEAAAKLVMASGAEVASFSFVIELEDLNGRERIKDYCDLIDSLVKF